MNISPPFGIDLGTTRTAAAVFLPGDAEPDVAADSEGHPTLPSVLRSAGDERWRVGRDALDASDDHPLVTSVKRHMGTGEALRNAPELGPDEASAIIVSAIAARLDDHLQRHRSDLPIRARDAVITVPAYFDAPQIEATRRAGELAGLRVRGLVQEPTAAAIYHTWRHDLGDGTFLVYDLGGGTFDVSIIRAIFGEYQVLSIDGDNHLGGDDFDRRLADRFRAQLLDEGFDVGEELHTDDDQTRFDILSRVARSTKERLSDAERVDVDEASLFSDRSGESVDLNMTVHRRDFDDAVDDLLEATVLSCRSAIDTARRRHDLEPCDIDGIFLVGGSTRVPAVRDRLRRSLADELSIDDDRIVGDEPETSVARGAALHAAAVCPVRFEDDSGEVTVAVTDLPSDNPDRRLIGHVDTELDPPPTHICFGAGDDGQPGDDAIVVALEDRHPSRRFSVPDFSATKMPPATRPHVAISLLDAGHLVFGPAHLWLPERPEEAKPAPTLALTNPAVLAKAINVEVVDDGKPTRHTLIDEGTHLPTTAHHQLVTADRSGSLVLRLFQHRLPIHTLVLSLPDDTPPGTPVELTVDVDQAINVTASGTVDEQTFRVRIDRPSAPRRRRWDEIETLIERAEDVADRLWGVEARRFRARSRNLLAGIRAAARHDPKRLQVLARRLESLLEDYGPRPHRTPGRGRIDTLLDTIRRLVFASDDDRLGRSREQWRRQLDELAEEVDRAWRGDDDAAWQSVADRVQATYESIAQDEYLFRRRDPDQYAQTLFETTQARLHKVRRNADGFPYAADGDARKLQRREIDAILASIDELRDKFPNRPSPSDVSTLERLARSVTHLERRLERVHTIGVPRSGEST